MFLDTKTIQWKLSRVETTQSARNVPGTSPEGALKKRPGPPGDL